MYTFIVEQLIKKKIWMFQESLYKENFGNLHECEEHNCEMEETTNSIR